MEQKDQRPRAIATVADETEASVSLVYEEALASWDHVEFARHPQ